MKLIYRGVPYEPSVMADTAQPRPSRSAHQPADSPIRLRHPGAELTYRGVRYTP
ncbi:DUF4278 domain-containing protein [Leptolyngbya iicbica]|uniref:DUF4278 domain-containing protein n=2 Tax=Cyanophyceae TaxID=3028117 RepID=A0A4Q7E209_9CYAN|nr:DUF4278 domain-containing protein [Leptolyngbya sp. LK]RZM75600.1 DUF4278 domain-containing protein [Leptolyngbya sp. LK]